MKKSRPAKKIGRKRRAAGWTLLTLGVLVAGVCAATGWGVVAYRTPYRQYTFVPGSFGVVVHDVPIPSTPAYPHGWTRRAAPNYFWPWSWPLFPLMSSEQLTTSYGPPPAVSVQDTATWIALWPIPLLLWTPAALLLRSGILARRRAVTGACPKCGYSLAGLGDGVACPECGKAWEIKATTK